MSNAPSTNVGSPIINPGMAVTPPAGSEVSGTPAANPVAGAGQAQGSSQIPVPGPASGGSGEATTGDSVVNALDAGSSAIDAWRASLGTYLAPESPPAHVARPWEDVVNAMRIFVTLLSDDPTLASDVDPHALELDADRVAAGKALEAAVTGFLKDLKVANRQPLAAGWKGVLAAYPTASRRAEAPGNTKLASSIAPVVAMFKQSPRDVSAVTKAAAQSLDAVKSSNKAWDSE